MPATTPSRPAPGPAEQLPRASWGRRFAALTIDWFACTMVCILALGGLDNWQSTPWASWLTMGIFLAELTVGVAFAAGSFGQLALRLRVLKTTGGGLSIFAALLRAFLICLVIPPLVFRPDGRGLHDLAVNSAVYRLP